MKQKNLTAIAVATGFGLVALYLATRIVPGPVTPTPPEEVDVLVAAQDIPPNTKLTPDMLPPLSNAWVTTKKWPKTHVPAAYVASVADLTDKKVTRALPKDGYFAPTDVNARGSIEIATGMNMITIPIGREALVGGFAVPGNKVDLLATFQLRKTRGPTVFPLLTSLKILAVDQATATVQGSNSIAAFSNVSFEVTKKQAMILDLVNGRGIRLSAILPSDKADDYPPNVPKGEDEVWKMLEAEFNPPPPTIPTVTSVRVLMANADLKAGTKLTPELLATPLLIGGVEMALPAPEGTIDDPQKFLGKVLTRDVSKGQLLLASLLGEKAPAPAAGETFPDIHKLRIQTASSMKTFEFARRNGEWTFLGMAPTDR